MVRMEGREMTANTLAASTSGVIHLVRRGTYNATPCNSRNAGFRVSRIAEARAQAAANYCRKCFPSGKPTAERIADLMAAN